ncbi:MAG: hypothetical protein J0L52_11370 [Caulobacterales bacterium]|nr:hypothetical protein [Caulobacterales bacterium]
MAQPKRRKPPGRASEPVKEPVEPAPVVVSIARTPVWKLLEAGATVAAFLLSLGVFLLGGLQTLQGAEVVVLEPQYVYLYRDAPTPESDSLILAVEAGMINTARADYGDVAVEAFATLGGTSETEARFPYDASVEPVTHPHDEARVIDCPVDARCVTATGANPLRPGQMSLLIIERRSELLSIPGGSSRATWMSFAFGNCHGHPNTCARFSTFEGAMQELRNAPELAFEITLAFHSDGRKLLRCSLEETSESAREEFLTFLEERGWATLRCSRELQS